MDNADLASTAVVSSVSSTASDLWDSGSTALRAQLAEATWNTWFRQVRPVRCEDDVLVLAVPSAVACERIRSSYSGLLTDLLHEVISRGHAVSSVGIYQGWLEVDTFDDYRRAWTEVEQ